MLIGLKLFIKNADSVPELWVLDILKAIERVLVSVKGLLKVINEQVAVAKGSPGGSIVLIHLGDLVVIADGCIEVSIGCTELCEFVQPVKRRLVFHRWCLGVVDTRRHLLLLGHRLVVC